MLFPEPINDRINTITMLMTFPNQEGEFTLNDVPPGNYRAVTLTLEESVLHSNAQFLHKKALAAPVITIKAGQTTNVDLPE